MSWPVIGRGLPRPALATQIRIIVMWCVATRRPAELSIFIHLAERIDHHLDRVMVQHLIAATHTSPHLGRAQFGCGDRGLCLYGAEVFVRNKARVAVIDAR